MAKLKATSEFGKDEMIPARYTADGKNISPPLRISDVDPEALSLAIIVDDPDAPMSTFTHWLIWNIPPSTREIPEGIPVEDKVDSLNGARQGKNDFGDIGYGGPAPPRGTHNYKFKVYALDQMLDLEPGAGKEELLAEIEDKMLQKTILSGKYSRE